MGEAALSYWLDEYICPSTLVTEEPQEDVAFLATGENDDDWKYGTD